MNSGNVFKKNSVCSSTHSNENSVYLYHSKTTSYELHERWSLRGLEEISSVNSDHGSS